MDKTYPDTADKKDENYGDSAEINCGHDLLPKAWFLKACENLMVCNLNNLISALFFNNGLWPRARIFMTGESNGICPGHF